MAEFIYPYVILDRNLVIGDVTKSFFEQLGFTRSQIGKIRLNEFFFRQKITTFI